MIRPLREGEERVGSQSPDLWMLPARERLSSEKPIIGHAILRLEDYLDLVAIDGGQHVSL